MTKRQLMNAMPTILFIGSCIATVGAVVCSGRDTLKAHKILEEKKIWDTKETYRRDEEGNVTLVGFEKRPIKEYAPLVVKNTWKCYIPTAVCTSLSLGLGIASHALTYKQIAALSAAVASAGSLVTKYRQKIREYADEDVLHDIDREIAKDEIPKAQPPIIATNGLLSCEEMDLAEDGEYLFFDPFTHVKFRSTKLGVLGAKYYLNRNFSLGGSVPLSTFYMFLGMELPEEYKNAGWDVDQMSENGYYWIDIDIVRSNAPDPETGEMYYILEYDYLPGDEEDNYYPFGNPLSQEGSYAV